jgi:hypothetical protein
LRDPKESWVKEDLEMPKAKESTAKAAYDVYIDTNKVVCKV